MSKLLNPKIIIGLVVVILVFLAGFVVSLIDQSKVNASAPAVAASSSLSIEHKEGANDYYVSGLIIGDNPIPDSQKEIWADIVNSPESLDQVASSLTTSTSTSLEEIKQAMVDSLQTGVLTLKP